MERQHAMSAAFNAGYNEKFLIKLSKFLAYVLRHNPDKLDLTLDAEGFVNICDVVENINKDRNNQVSTEDIYAVCMTDDKQRYQIKDGKIRAVQGHSIEVDLKLENKEPPEFLYHSTFISALDSIKEHGICKCERNYVHMNSLEESQRLNRNPKVTTVLKIRALDMYYKGFAFYQALNGVWLTKHVPPMYVNF